MNHCDAGIIKNFFELGEVAAEVISCHLTAFEHLERPLAAVPLISQEIKRFTPSRLTILAEIGKIAKISAAISS